MRLSLSLMEIAYVIETQSHTFSKEFLALL